MPTSNKQAENPWLNLGLNILLPVLILKQGPSWLGLTPGPNLLLALAFPVCYFIYDAFARRKANLISILGFISILLTGGIGLLELPRSWFIAKEAGIPFILGLVLLISIKTRWPLIKLFLYNDAILDTERIDRLLQEKQHQKHFEKLMRLCTCLIAASFFFSAVVQFILASVIVTVEPADNPERFNEQIGDMTWITWVVIMVPSMAITAFALWRLVCGLEGLTGLGFEEMLAEPLREKAAEQAKTD